MTSILNCAKKLKGSIKNAFTIAYDSIVGYNHKKREMKARDWKIEFIVLAGPRSATGAIFETISKKTDDLMGFHFMSSKSCYNTFRMIFTFTDNSVLLNSIRLFPRTCLHFIFGNHIKSRIKSAKILTMVREPVARELSQFLHVNLRRNNSISATGELSDVYKSFYEAHKRCPEFATEWFEQVFFTDTGVDVFSKPFDKQAGYGFIPHEKFPTLIISAESARDPRKLPGIINAVNEFTNLGIDEFINETTEMAINMPYYARYREIVDNFVASDEYLDSLYNTKFMRHFYTDEDILNFRKKWQKNTP